MPGKTISQLSPEEKRAYHREWRSKNKEKVASANRRWRERHPEQLREIQRQSEAKRDLERRRANARKRYAANAAYRLQQIEYLREWRKKNPGKSRAAGAAWARANAAKVKSDKRKYFETHREQNAQSRRAWKKRNPQQVKADNAARNNRIRRVGGKITAEEVLALYERQRGRCAACNKRVKLKYHLDHIMPLALGGMHEIGNAQILCPRCNVTKHAMHPDDWAKKIGKLFV
jgi:5-methylcytosine-specific restriction endonuclease McrA